MVKPHAGISNGDNAAIAGVASSVGVVEAVEIDGIMVSASVYEVCANEAKALLRIEFGVVRVKETATHLRIETSISARDYAFGAEAISEVVEVVAFTG